MRSTWFQQFAAKTHQKVSQAEHIGNHWRILLVSCIADGGCACFNCPGKQKITEFSKSDQARILQQQVCNHPVKQFQSFDLHCCDLFFQLEEKQKAATQFGSAFVRNLKTVSRRLAHSLRACP